MRTTIRSSTAAVIVPVPDYRTLTIAPPAPVVLAGFTPLFNGRDLNGRRVSGTARLRTQPAFRVAQGMILGTQQPIGDFWRWCNLAMCELP